MMFDPAAHNPLQSDASELKVEQYYIMSFQAFNAHLLIHKDYFVAVYAHVHSTSTCENVRKTFPCFCKNREHVLPC